eukprot:5094171-Amphidinium_carterae.1
MAIITLYASHAVGDGHIALCSEWANAILEVLVCLTEAGRSFSPPSQERALCRGSCPLQRITSVWVVTAGTLHIISSIRPTSSTKWKSLRMHLCGGIYLSGVTDNIKKKSAMGSSSSSKRLAWL